MTIGDRTYFSDASHNSPIEPEAEVGKGFVPNISLKERKKREKFAIQYFIFTLFVLVMLILFDVNPLWRLPLLFMFSTATTSYVQSLDKT